MPVCFVRQDANASRVFVAEERFWIGSDLDAHLVLRDPRVAPMHAKLTYKKGEHVLSGGDGPIWVNRERVPLMPLRHGDVVALTPPEGEAPIQLAFENRIEDSFVPPGMSFAEAWIAHPRSADDDGPDAYDEGDLIDDRNTARIRRVTTSGDDLVIKVLGPARSSEEAHRYLALLSRLAGAPHGSLAEVVDGGLFRQDHVVLRWMATRYVEGRISRLLIGRRGLEPLKVIDILTPIAYGLKHLHRRGLVHRDVAPANVIVRPDGRGFLIDFGQTVAWEDGVPASAGVIGTPGYVAPEEVVDGGGQITPAVDVYGLAAVGYALLTGRAPVVGEEVLEMLAGALARPHSPTELGFEVPKVLEAAIMRGLAPAPNRPSIQDFIRACEDTRAIVEPDWIEE